MLHCAIGSEFRSLSHPRGATIVREDLVLVRSHQQAKTSRETVDPELLGERSEDKGVERAECISGSMQSSAGVVQNSVVLTGSGGRGWGNAGALDSFTAIVHERR